MSSHTLGVVLTLCYAAITWGFVVATHRWVHIFSPIAFGAITSLIAAIVSFGLVLQQRSLADFKKPSIYVPLLIISCTIVVIPHIFLSLGTQRTSGTNTAILMLAEIIWTLLRAPFFGEKITRNRIIGATWVLVWACFVLWQWSFDLNLWDILILLSTLSFPIGNFYTKKVLTKISPMTAMFFRFLLGWLFLFAISLYFEPHAYDPTIWMQYIRYILFIGIWLLVWGKILRYQALKHLEVSKAIPLIMTHPLFSLSIFILFFWEQLSLHHIIGMIIISAGVYFTVQRR